MAQASRGILPRDEGGPFGIRLGVSVGGNLAWGLRVGAYVTHRVSSTDWLRYSLVVLNWYVDRLAGLARQTDASSVGTTAPRQHGTPSPSKQRLSSEGPRYVSVHECW